MYDIVTQCIYTCCVSLSCCVSLLFCCSYDVLAASTSCRTAFSLPTSDSHWRGGRERMEGENRENKLLVQTVYMPKLKPDKEGERRTQQKSRPNQQLKLTFARTEILACSCVFSAASSCSFSPPPAPPPPPTLGEGDGSECCLWRRSRED